MRDSTINRWIKERTTAKRNLLFAIFFAVAGIAIAEPTFDRSSWTNWSGKWAGDFWTPGYFGKSRFMTCVCVDGSQDSPEFWAAGIGDVAFMDAYQQTQGWSNTASRNIAFIEVYCGY